MEPGPAWEEAGHYAGLLQADRLTLAWEWLRRTPAYRSAHAAARSAGPWGLHRLIDPVLAAPNARPMWTARATGQLLRCHALADGDGRGNMVDLGELGELVAIETSSGGEHLLISDGLRAIRIDVVSGTVRQGPVTLRYELSGLASAEAPLLALRRFLAIARSGSFSAMLHRPERRAGRWVRELRTFDALASGATQREIAARLLAADAAEPRWRLHSPSLRLQAQRLVRRARHMAGGGYRDLL